MLKKAILIICFFPAYTKTVKCQLIPERIPISYIERHNKEFMIGKVAISNPLTKSLKDYFQITDTIDFVQNGSDLVEVEGFNFQFNMKIQRDSIVYKSGSRQILLLESRISPYQSWRYDITNLSCIELATVIQELREKPYHKPVLGTSSNQSCISYALEGIFRSHGINPEPFFFRRSSIANHNDVEAILKNLFVKVETLDNIKRNTLRKSNSLHEEQVFILFRNIQGEPMHACINLDGRIWTKNGYMPYMSHSSLQPVIETYNGKKHIKSNYSKDTNKSFKLSTVSEIEIYKLNNEIFE